MWIGSLFKAFYPTHTNPVLCSLKGPGVDTASLFLTIFCLIGAHYYCFENLYGRLYTFVLEKLATASM